MHPVIIWFIVTAIVGGLIALLWKGGKSDGEKMP